MTNDQSDFAERVAALIGRELGDLRCVTEGEALFRRALDSHRSRTGMQDSELASLHRSFANFLQHVGRISDAEAELASAQALVEPTSGA